MKSEKSAREILKKQYERQNKYISEKYKRLSVAVRLDVYENIRAVYGDKISMNKYINDLIAADLKNKTDNKPI